MRIAPLLLAGGILCAGSAAQGVGLGFDPPASEVPVGSPVVVRVVVSGLADAGAPSIGTFDFDVLYDPAVLAFTGVDFGDPVLGDQLDLAGFGSISGFDDSVAGTLNLFELSVDLPDDLDALQAGSFTLATLTFEALGAGSSGLSFAALILGDSLGDPLAVDPPSPGSITVVPEPASAALASSGILLLALFRRLGSGPLRRASQP